MRALCLDIGNVIGKVEFDTFTAILSSVVNIPQQEAHVRINRYQGLHDVGLMDMHQILGKEFDVKSEELMEFLISEWTNVLPMDKRVINRLETISSKILINNYGCIVSELKLALLSNVGQEHANYISERFGECHILDTAIKYFSCEVGSRKPQSLYFQSFLDRYPRFINSVYVDDRQENLDASVPYGFIPVRLDLSTMSDLEIESRLDAIEKLVMSG